MARQRLLDAFVAGAVFGGTVFAFEVALYLPRLQSGVASYLAAIAALTLAGALIAGLVATLVAGRAAPQATVVSLAALTLLGAGRELESVDLARAAAVAVVLVLALLLDREARRRPLELALASAIAVVGAFRVFSWACDALVPLRPLRNGWAAAGAEALVFTTLLAALLVYLGVCRRRLARLPALGPLATIGIALAAVLMIGEESEPTRSVREQSVTAAGQQPSILLLVLDTVGADRLSIYGHSRETTPELQSFLDRNRRAVLYPLGFATAAWTSPSHASLFTGLLPSEHGVERWRPGGTPRVHHPLLAQALRDRGYRTAAIVANPMLDTTPGLFAGFDLVVRRGPLHRPRLTLGEILRARWLPQIGARAMKPAPHADFVNQGVLDAVRDCGDDSCFVFANYMDAHVPYVPPAPHAGLWSDAWAPNRFATDGDRLERSAARHDEAIRALDAALGLLLRELASSGALDRWWLVITSDHGEAFGEHGYAEHGRGLHVELTKIPLLIQPPSTERLVPRPEPVSLLDVAATIAAAGGVEGFGVGDDLRQQAVGTQPVRMEFAGRSRLRSDPSSRTFPPARAVVVGRRQLIESADGMELYDLGEDPREQRNLAAAAADEVERLIALLPPGFSPEEAPMPLDSAADAAESAEDTRRDLRALGYLD